MKTTKPTTTKAASAKPDTAEQGTKLAQVNDPAKLTDAKIKEITADDGSDDAENTANKDAAETLKQAKSEAKGDEPVRGYFHGQGGGAGDL